jgi:hypothetical protein
MKTLATGMRVKVLEDEDKKAVNKHGTVIRVCSDGERAWVQLDSKKGKVRVYPDGCEPSDKENRKGRRAARRDESAPTPTLGTFGRDHWSTFAYLTTLGCEGVPDRRRMRCGKARHPLLMAIGQEMDGGAWPTRLQGGVELHNHDDWDCVGDLENEGLVDNVGSGINPVFRLTEFGSRVCRELGEHKRQGGSFANFICKEPYSGDAKVAQEIDEVTAGVDR